MLFHQIPFPGKDYKEMLKMIEKTNMDKRMSQFTKISKEAKDFIKLGL